MSEMIDAGTFWTVRAWSEKITKGATNVQIGQYVDDAIKAGEMPASDRDMAIGWIELFADPNR